MAAYESCFSGSFMLFLDTGDKKCYNLVRKQTGGEKLMKELLTFDEEKNGFVVRSKLEGTKFIAILSGKADTIGAPALLDSFRQAQEQGEITDVLLDMSDLTYISSSGLRVLLTMKKSIGSGSFKMNGQNDTIKMIMEATGFADVL